MCRLRVGRLLQCAFDRCSHCRRRRHRPDRRARARRRGCRSSRRTAGATKERHTPEHAADTNTDTRGRTKTTDGGVRGVCAVGRSCTQRGAAAALHAGEGRGEEQKAERTRVGDENAPVTQTNEQAGSESHTCSSRCSFVLSCAWSKHHSSRGRWSGRCRRPAALSFQLPSCGDPLPVSHSHTHSRAPHPLRHRLTSACSSALVPLPMRARVCLARVGRGWARRRLQPRPLADVASPDSVAADR